MRREVAAAHGGNPAQLAQLALAWALTRVADIVPLIGACRRAQLQDAIAALEVRLSPDKLAQIEAAVPVEAVAGGRAQRRLRMPAARLPYRQILPPEPVIEAARSSFVPPSRPRASFALADRNSVARLHLLSPANPLAA